MRHSEWLSYTYICTCMIIHANIIIGTIHPSSPVPPAPSGWCSSESCADCWCYWRQFLQPASRLLCHTHQWSGQKRHNCSGERGRQFRGEMEMEMEREMEREMEMERGRGRGMGRQAGS